MSQYNTFNYNMLETNIHQVNLPFTFQHPIIADTLDQRKTISNYAHDVCNPNESILTDPFANYNTLPIIPPNDMAFPPLLTINKQLEKEAQEISSNKSTTFTHEKTTKSFDMLSTLLQHEECKELLDSPPMHIVSPEAIQEAIKEEKEEAMGHSQRRPFSRFASINALKQRIPFVGLPPSLPANVPITTNLPSSTIIPPISIAHSSFTLPNIKEEDEDSDGTKATVSSSTKARKSEKPKRPPNAYLLFNRDMRRKLLQTSPRMTVAEISKEIGDNWKVLPNDQRSRYVQEASILKQEHLKKHPDFIYTRRSKAELAEAKRNPKPNKQNSTSKQTFSLIQAMPADNSKSTLVIENSRRKAKRSLLNGQKDPRGRKKKRYKHPFAPKHPMSAYLHYLASVYPQVSAKFPGSTVGPISKSISRTWHAMSAEERLPWKQKADSDKARYAQEMKVYMAKNDLDKHEEKLSHASDEEEEEEGEANEIQYFHSQVFYRLSDEMNNKHVNLN